MQFPVNADESVIKAILELQREHQYQSYRWLDEPSVIQLRKEVAERGFVFATVSGTSYIYTRKGTQLFRTQLTPV